MTENIDAIRADLRARIKYECGRGPAPSALPSLEPQGTCERSRLATCSNAVPSAEAAVSILENMAWQETKAAVSTWLPWRARASEIRAEAYEVAARKIRTEMGLKKVRQPQ